MAHSIVGGSAWEPTPWRAVQRAAWEVLNGTWDRTDHLVRCGDPCHDPGPHMPQGQADVAAVVQAKVAAGLLPRERPSKMWVGPGTGKTCDSCEQPITKDDREYEFDPPGWPILRLHQACVEAWHVHRAIQGGSANSFTLDTSAARIAAVLRESFPSGFCVACLAARLDVPISEVRGAAQVVVARPGFRVVERVCYTCGGVNGDVVAFVPDRST